jgi:DNA repair photolyase
MSVIYEPKGRAKEYSLLACNLFTGCVHGCNYCYAPQTLHITPEQFKTNVKPRPGIIEALRKEAPKYQGTDNRVLLCFTCDPYQTEEIEQGITRKALEIFREFDIPFQVLTKGGMRAARDFDLYGPNDAFATTLTLFTKYSAIIYEPNAAEPRSRITAIREAKKRGIITWVSLEPVIIPDDSLLAIEEYHEYVDLFKIGKLNYVTNDIDWQAFGCEAIELCEHYGVPYYIKDDLAKYMSGIEFHNTDTRTINRKLL